MKSERQVYFDPVLGEMRFDKAYPEYDNILEQICWPIEQQRANKKYGFKNLTLALTMRCNLDCTYCWQKHNDVADMDLPTIDSWLDFFIDSTVNAPNKILYYGGEPLLRMDLITYAAQRMKLLCGRRGLPQMQQHIFTNGTLLSEENLEILQEAGVFLIVSLDGNPRCNSAHRRTTDGRSAHLEIMRGIERLHRLGMSFGVCCTICEVDFDVEAVVGYVLNEVKPSTIELNLRHDKAFCKEALKYKKHYLGSFAKAWNMIRQHKVKNIDLCKRISALAERIPLQNSSSGSKNKLSVMTNGMVSTFNGAVSFPELQIEPNGDWIKLFKERWNRNVLTSECCKNCKAAFICGQGSAFSSYLQYGDFSHTPALHCEYCNTLLQYTLQTIKQELLTQREIPYGFVVKKKDIQAVFPTLLL
jgi:uncharacterized protein